MLNIKNVSIKVANKEILHDLNLKINEGEIHVLMGPNGIGKSSICKTIMKAPGYEVTSGTITYNNQNLQELTTDTIAKLGIMFIMQNPTAVEGVTNAELLRTALSTKNNEHVDIFKFNKEMENICQKINLPKSFIHRNVNEGMSGGERKKNELLHVWMLKPQLLLLDEIDSGLDIDAIKVVANSLKEYHDLYNPSIILVTHNPQLLEILKPNYIHIINDKKIAKTGGPELINEIISQGFKTNVMGEKDHHE